MTIPLTMMASDDDRPRSAPVIYARPCCPPDSCSFRPTMIRSYLFARNLAQILHEPWDVVLADQLRGRADEVSLLVQSNRGHGSLTSRARDIVLSLERCRDELRIPLTFSNCTRLALACCRFAVQESED